MAITQNRVFNFAYGIGLIFIGVIVFFQIIAFSAIGNVLGFLILLIAGIIYLIQGGTMVVEGIELKQAGKPARILGFIFGILLAFFSLIIIISILGLTFYDWVVALDIITFIFGLTVIINALYTIFQMFITLSMPIWFRSLTFLIELIVLVIGILMVLSTEFGVVVLIFYVGFILVFNGIRRLSRAFGDKIVEQRILSTVKVEPLKISPHEIQGNAVWHETNGQKYLEVTAPNHYDLGYLQGQMVEKQIQHLHGIIQILSLRYIPRNKMGYNDYLKLAKNYEPFIPKHLRLEMLGMSDAIKGLSYDDILVQNCFIDILYGRLLPTDSLSIILRAFDLGCTSFGAIMPDFVLRGQNFDFASMFYDAQYFSLLRVSGKPDIFSLRLGSMLGFPAGHNSYGLSINVNIIKSIVQAPYTIPASVKTRVAFEDSEDAESAYDYIWNVDLPASCNLLLADSERIIAIENVPNKHSRVDVSDTVVRSNTFVSKTVEHLLVRKKYSKKRQRRGEKLINEAYQQGPVTDEKLIEILSDEPIICRLRRLQPQTIAFITNKYFGLGNPKYDKHGLVPLKNIGIKK